jgi:8-oxo-dGTP diphosphatase
MAVSFDPFRAPVAVHGILRNPADGRDRTGSRDGGRVLLMRRAGTGYRDGQLSLPAGHLDGGEDAVTGLVRELREELDIETDPSACRLALLMHAAPEDAEDLEYLHLFFFVDAWTGGPRIAEPEKCTELRWTETGALPPDVVDYVAAAFAAITRGESLTLYGWPSH